MHITINLDLETAIAQALTPEKLQPILDKHVTDAITSAISKATDYRSDFQKALSAQLAEVMPHGLKLRDIAKFQHVLNSALQSVIHGQHSDTVNAALAAVAKAELPEVPTLVKLSDLMGMAREAFRHGDQGAFYALFDRNESYSGGGWLYLDREEKPGSGYGLGGGKYHAAYQLAFSGEGEVYALKLRDRQVTPASRPDVIGWFDAVLMSMYVGRTRLEIDMDPDDVQSVAAEQYGD